MHQYKMYGYVLCACEHTFFYFSEETQNELFIDDNTFKKFGYVGDKKNHFIFHFVLFIIFRKGFFHQLRELLKENSLVTFEIFSLRTFLYENFMRCYLKVEPSPTITL